MIRILAIVLLLFSLSLADSFAEPLLNVEQVIGEKSPNSFKHEFSCTSN